MNEPDGSRTVTGAAAPGRGRPGVHFITQAAGAVADMALTTAVPPGLSVIRLSGTAARLLYLTSATAVATAWPAALRTASRGQPCTEQEDLAVLRNMMFQARLPMP